MTDAQIAFTAPHWAATETGLNILQAGGTATEAMVAAAAVISVVYPHMNSIGGDGFWLIHTQGELEPMAIDACGRSAENVERLINEKTIAERGALACITQAATIAGWQLALRNDANAKMPLETLLADAIKYADEGIKVTDSMAAAIQKVMQAGKVAESFKKLYAPNNQPLLAGDLFRNNALANTFRCLAENGLDDFYQGKVGDIICQQLQSNGSVLTGKDHRKTAAGCVKPLSVKLSEATCFNLPAPTQGVHSLQILAIVEQLKNQATTEADWVHLIVEATKQSFSDREAMLTDPACVTDQYAQALRPETIQQKAKNIQLQKAEAWPKASEQGDTVWMGACDKNGQMVSFIQSIYWEFGSAFVIDGAGFVWNNRGVSFSLEQDDINRLAGSKKPRHTLNPAFAVFDDGRRLSYGTMGGDGQPQTQAAIFSRFVWQQSKLDESIANPRWLLGRTWGESHHDLKLEASLAQRIGQDLTARNHRWHEVADCNEMMGHAGAIFENNNQLTAATDPRSDGSAQVQPFNNFAAT